MQINTKYNKGDEVWFMHENKPAKAKIFDFTIQCVYVKGAENDRWGSESFPIIIRHRFTMHHDELISKAESECFPTKEELLQSLLTVLTEEQIQFIRDHSKDMYIRDIGKALIIPNSRVNKDVVPEGYFNYKESENWLI